jgi:hypothetical protein
MTTTDLDTYTDHIAKTNSTMFPSAEKLTYYNIAYGLLYSLIVDEQEDTLESEPTPITTVADTGNYAIASRLHHINWAKVDYGTGLIPARKTTQQDLISEYGNELETVLAGWDHSDPIYWLENGEINIRPKPTSAQAGAGRLQYSAEILPSDMTAGQSPSAIPPNYHYLLGEYAALRYHENQGEDTFAVVRKRNFDEGARLMLETMFPVARQSYIQAHIPDEDGSNY